jgi:hypothetical protein
MEATLAQNTINSNSVQPYGVPNTGTSVEQGDSWDAAVTKLNAMFTDLYQGARALVAGAGTAIFGPSGNISANVTLLGSSNTNTTQNLMSYVLPANTLKNAGQGIMVTAWGQKAANAAGVTFALTVGGLTINTGNVTSSGSSWMMEAVYFKTGASAQAGNLNAITGLTPVKTVSGTDTSVDTGTINIGVTILDASAGQSNVLMDGLIVEFFN